MRKSTIRSYVSPTTGQAFYKSTGRYNEVTKAARNTMKNDAPSALKQKGLSPKGNTSAASQSLEAALQELGW
jgi:hypothetical protein